jgi:hypothetical protein
MKYLHEATEEEIRTCKTYGDLAEKFEQPEWCNHPHANAPIIGCWSLMDLYGLRKSISKEFCKTCSECKHHEPELE